MVSDDHHRVFCSGEVMPPFLECLDYCQEFSIVNVIVSFSWREGGGVIHAGMKVSIGVLLHEYSSSSCEWGISHDKERFGSVRHLDYWG